MARARPGTSLRRLLLLLTLLWAVNLVSGFNLRQATSSRISVPVSPSQPCASGISAATCSPLFTSRRRDLGSSLSVSTTADVDSGPEAERKTLPFPLVLWRFTRPHTLIGSALAIPALHVLAAPSFQAVWTLPTLTSILFAMVPSLLMNLYITGLNQVTDVEIDKINKPNLVIASGDLSPRNASWIVLVALLSSLWMGAAHSVLGTSGLNTALWGSGILGTLYSLPPFRLKRFPLLAAFCIVVVRGTIINAGFFAHAKVAAFGGARSASSVLHYLLTDRACMLSSLFFGIFGIVIALMKDVPDVKGDEVANVRTFSVRIGQKRIFWSAKNLLIGLFYSFGAGFLYQACFAPSRIIAACRSIVGVSSLAAGISVNKEAATVDAEDPKEVYTFYMHLWKLFYLAYLVLPFAR